MFWLSSYALTQNSSREVNRAVLRYGLWVAGPNTPSGCDVRLLASCQQYRPPHPDTPPGAPFSAPRADEDWADSGAGRLRRYQDKVLGLAEGFPPASTVVLLQGNGIYEAVNH